MEYRNKVEKIVGLKLKKDFDIHHIDFDNTNNNISNLMILPKKIHSDFHKNIIENFEIENKIKSCYEKGNKINNFNYDNFKKFIKIYNICQEWKVFSDSLFFNYPNNTMIKKENVFEER